MKKLKNIKARLLSLSLAFAMVLSLISGIIPMSVYAAENGGGTEVTDTWTLTVDTTNASDFNGQLMLLELDSSGDIVEKGDDYNMVMVENDAEIIITKGNDVFVAGYTGGYTVTVSDTNLASVGDFIVSDAEDGYLISDIIGNNTIIIESSYQETQSLTITQQPVDVTVNEGETATFTVEASGSGELRYQWEVDFGLGFTTATGISTNASYTTYPTTAEEDNGIEYRCVITDGTGNSVISNEVTLTVNAQQTPPAHTHTIEAVDRKAPTCQEAGYQAHFKCTGCEQLFSDSEGSQPIEQPETIPADGRTHDYSVFKSSEAGHWYECLCGEADRDEYDDKDYHTDTDSNNKCDDCEYVVYHVAINQDNYYHYDEQTDKETKVYAVQLCGANNRPFKYIYSWGSGTFLVPAGCSVVVYGTGSMDDAKALGANTVLVNGEEISNSGCKVSNFTRNTVIVINPPAPAPTPTPNPDNGNSGGSNGGSSSSSDTSSTPSTTTPAPSTAPITVPVSNGANENTVHINASVSGETAKVSELTAEEINKVANNETNTNSIEINLSETGKNVKEAALPVSSLNEIARIMDDPNNKLDNITIKLSTATVEVSEHTLKAVLSKTTGNDLRLVVDDVQKDTLNNTQKEAVKNQNVHQCIDAYFISNGVRIGDFQGGTATIRLPFDVPAGLNGNGFSVWYIGDDGTIEKHDTQYVNGELVFTVSHFSDYVVVYDGAVKDNVPKTGEATDYTFILWTSILAIGVLGLVLNRQKRRQ